MCMVVAFWRDSRRMSDVKRAAWLVDHILQTLSPEEAVSNTLVWNSRPHLFVHLVAEVLRFERIYQKRVWIASLLELNNSQMGQVRAEHFTTL